MHSEIKRRLVHVSGTGLPALYLLNLLTWQQLQYLLLLGSVSAVVLEAIRLYVGLDWRIFEELTREYEQENLAGYALYAFGMTVTAFAFPPVVAVPAILMLTVADPISGVLGSGELGVKAGHTLLVTFAVCVAIASLFTLPLVAAVFGALVATLADGVKPVIAGYVIDDNLTIPIGAGVAMFLSVRYLPAVA